MFSLAMDIAALALAANAIVFLASDWRAFMPRRVTVILTAAGLLFLFAFVHWYDATIGDEHPKW